MGTRTIIGRRQAIRETQIMAFSLQDLYEPINLPRMETGGIQAELDKIIARYQPGGEFGKPEMALLERAKTKTLARQKAGLVSRGMAGTTVGAGLGKKWEEEVGMPAKLGLEDIRTQRLVQAMTAKAGFMERAQAANISVAQSEAEMELRRVLAAAGLNAQQQASALQALASVHAARYGGGGGGERRTWKDYFGDTSMQKKEVVPYTGPPGADNGATTRPGATAGAFTVGGRAGEYASGGYGGQAYWEEKTATGRTLHPTPPGLRDEGFEDIGRGFGVPGEQGFGIHPTKEWGLGIKGTPGKLTQSFQGAGYTGNW